jgi:hypothetical protein
LVGGYLDRLIHSHLYENALSQLSTNMRNYFADLPIVIRESHKGMDTRLQSVLEGVLAIKLGVSAVSARVTELSDTFASQKEVYASIFASLSSLHSSYSSFTSSPTPIKATDDVDVSENADL